MDRNPDTGRRMARFPMTRPSALAAARSEDHAVRSRAVETLSLVYYRPIYRHLRFAWKLEPADADDLAQSFFTRAVEGDLFSRYDPARARFRTSLRTRPS